MTSDISNNWMRKAGPAVLVGLVSGVISAFAVEPGAQILEEISFLQDSLVGLLSILGLTAGLVFGLMGAVFGMVRLGLKLFAAALWLYASIIGMSAAFYVSILTFDNSPDGTASYVFPYLAASPVGALILGGAIVSVRPYARKPNLLACLVAGPTLWAVAVAGALYGAGSDGALDVPWLLPLFCGWQAIFLTIVTLWRSA